MSKPTSPTYKTTNWTDDNATLKRRRSLTSWFDPEMGWDAKPSGKRGRPLTFSDAAIQTCLTMTVLFGMALHQVQRDNQAENAASIRMRMWVWGCVERA